MISIDRLDAADIPVTEPLVDEFVQSHHVFNFRPEYWPPFRNWLTKLLNDPDAVVLVARAPEGLIGIGTGVIQDNGPLLAPERVGYVGFLSVSLEHQRQGIATALWDELRCWFTARGISEVQLYTELGNPTPEGFWTSQGFDVFLQRRRIQVD